MWAINQNAEPVPNYANNATEKTGLFFKMATPTKAKKNQKSNIKNRTAEKTEKKQIKNRK